jgi:Fur family peroxide stress response transcriptional regulator
LVYTLYNLAMHKHRDIGLKLTPQRIAILDCLKGNRRHPSAEDIYRTVLNMFPTMSFATVYTTLALLKKKQKVIELTIDPDKKRYDPETGCHNHLICVVCKQIVDVADAGISGLPGREEQGFKIIASHTEFYGLCPDCRKINPEQEENHVRRP